MIDNLKHISQSSAFMRQKPCYKSQIVNECIFGEIFEIKKITNNWAYGKLLTDNYEGWVEFDHLKFIKKATHRVISNKTVIYSFKNIKTAFRILSIGSQVSVITMEEEWTKIYLNNINGYLEGYILTSDLINLKDKINDWVKITENLIGVPYFWGGRTSNGIDCSALVQLSLQAFSINFPRDTKMQVQVKYKKIISLNSLKRGDLIFWKGHVGIMQNNKKIIHASSYHRKVLSEPLDKAIARIQKSSDSIKKIMRIQ